jgi:hypothetical protein
LLLGDKESLENLEWKGKNPKKVINIMPARTIKLKNLDLNPLSVAKYF